MWLLQLNLSNNNILALTYENASMFTVDELWHGLAYDCCTLWSVDYKSIGWHSVSRWCKFMWTAEWPTGLVNHRHSLNRRIPRLDGNAELFVTILRQSCKDHRAEHRWLSSLLIAYCILFKVRILFKLSV